LRENSLTTFGETIHLAVQHQFMVWHERILDQMLGNSSDNYLAWTGQNISSAKLLGPPQGRQD
jgi:hypothetical protein